MPSQSPKRASSKGKKGVDKDDVLLEARIEGFKIEYPRNLLLAFGLVSAFLPVYMAHAFFAVDWASLVNLVLFLITIGTAGNLLSQAYSVMVETEFLKRQRHYNETKSEKDAAVLRQLRLNVALAYSIFFVNALFVVVSSVLQGYILHQLDARLSLLVAPNLTAFALLVLAKKNEEARQRKIGRA
uniref:Translocon-associated protein subunit gamma n=1 Tax=Neobodo designis TaxID=312471 RepID=A0A7S1KX91_NEODS|mmetsp:Transcript_10316/g.31909  ORF Transcript_10316/g.31909 Transcript_10316/m.31909 type:complete len:185 (+) Transcript_10316:50-604(+)